LLPVALSLGAIPAPVVLLPGVPEPPLSAALGAGSEFRVREVLGSVMSRPVVWSDIPAVPPAPAVPAPAAPPPVLCANAKEEAAIEAVNADITRIFFMAFLSKGHSCINRRYLGVFLSDSDF
jgi:hypothetical protein